MLVRTSFALIAVPVLAAGLSACSLLGQTWEVEMEVDGPGSAKVAGGFSGQEDSEAESRTLPWREAANVGFGFNDLSVSEAEEGTTCRITVDGEVISEETVDEGGNAECFVNLQEGKAPKDSWGG
ncbi:hypothetical protein [Allosalinactinospora lopnorensis]|uniref:hypothetical protein n=1 Tax=Allosalinactinospora lopnorensis TaxID=1352348 RepID=UPI0012E3079F|nr:hypothetical protein [Allosalinactinospora lopnorensis]